MNIYTYTLFKIHTHNSNIINRHYKTNKTVKQDDASKVGFRNRVHETFTIFITKLFCYMYSGSKMLKWLEYSELDSFGS